MCSVVDRTRALLTELEARYQNANVVLVSHGDTLQVTSARTHARTQPFTLTQQALSDPVKIT